MPRSLHRYALGQISRPVGIVSACHRGEISEKLARDSLHNDSGLPGVRYLDEIIENVVVIATYANDVSASASQLGCARKDVRPRCVIGGQNQAGRTRFDQGDDAVLQFTSGKAL